MTIEALNNTLTALRAQEILDFDLSTLVLDGRRVFDMGDIKRCDMPQLRGFPIKGSLAEFFEADKKGKVDISGAFVNWLKRVHKAQIIRGVERAPALRGSQRELVASKIAGHIPKLMADPKNKKFTQLYYTSADNTLLDGHHGWGAVRCYELLTAKDVHLQVARIMMPTAQLIDLAHEFTTTVGVAPKEGL